MENIIFGMGLTIIIMGLIIAGLWTELNASRSVNINQEMVIYKLKRKCRGEDIDDL